MQAQFSHRIIRIKELSIITGLSKASIYDRLKATSPRYDPNFPKQVKLSTSAAINGAVGWLESDVLKWLEKCRNP